MILTRPRRWSEKSAPEDTPGRSCQDRPIIHGLMVNLRVSVKRAGAPAWGCCSCSQVCIIIIIVNCNPVHTDGYLMYDISLPGGILHIYKYHIILHLTVLQ